MIKIGIIIGSTRPGRNAEQVAKWVYDFASKRNDAEYENKTLTVVLHSLSAPRFNEAVAKLTEVLNQTETIFPGTDLILKFKSSAFSNCER